uniref:Uncharacterized protein n=1 Tax=viral metagenome TaxID=1070528 RepID=A0A6C0IE86_9ZZZZ
MLSPSSFSFLVFSIIWLSYQALSHRPSSLSVDPYFDAYKEKKKENEEDGIWF